MSASRKSRLSTLAAAVAATAILAEPAGAAPASSSLRLTGSVHGAVNAMRVVCDSHVASAKHHFFFDIGGTAAGGTFLLTGKVDGYTGPKSYRPFSALLMAGGHYLVAHDTGTISIGAGGTSAHLNMTLKTAPGAPPVTETIAGRFTCTNYTSQ